MLEKQLGKVVANTLIKMTTGKKSEKTKNREAKTLKKNEQKQMMIRLFGKTRYNLSVWFGDWFLYAYNHRDYSPVLYTKFYKTEEITQKYAKKLKEKYTIVKIQEVYDKDKLTAGYLLQGKGKKIAEASTQQPPNIIAFPKSLKIQ